MTDPGPPTYSPDRYPNSGNTNSSSLTATKFLVHLGDLRLHCKRDEGLGFRVKGFRVQP